MTNINLSMLRITLQERLQFAFKRELDRRREVGEKPLTKTILWKATKKTSSDCSRWFSGTNEMDLDDCTKVAPLLRVNPLWLFDESRLIDEDVPTHTINENINILVKRRVNECAANNMTYTEKLILKGFREASDEVRGIMLLIAEETIDKKEAVSKRKSIAKLQLIKNGH